MPQSPFTIDIIQDRADSGPFVADPFGRCIAAAVKTSMCSSPGAIPLIETVRRNWPFTRDRRVDAYGPILNRYIVAP